MSRWLPRFQTGGHSSMMIDGRGIEGRYVDFNWLGFSLSISLGSDYAEERRARRYRERTGA